MTQRELEITIGPDGKVEVHVRGFKGRSCLEVMKWLEETVGKSESQRMTSEFYDPEEKVQFRIDQRQ